MDAEEAGNTTEPETDKDDTARDETTHGHDNVTNEDTTREDGSSIPQSGESGDLHSTIEGGTDIRTETALADASPHRHKEAVEVKQDKENVTSKLDETGVDLAKDGPVAEIRIDTAAEEADVGDEQEYETASGNRQYADSAQERKGCQNTAETIVGENDATTREPSSSQSAVIEDDGHLHSSRPKRKQTDAASAAEQTEENPRNESTDHIDKGDIVGEREGGYQEQNDNEQNSTVGSECDKADGANDEQESEKYRATAHNVPEQPEGCQKVSETKLADENDATTEIELQTSLTTVKEKDDDYLQSHKCEQTDAAHAADQMEENTKNESIDHSDKDDIRPVGELGGGSYRHQEDSEQNSTDGRECDKTDVVSEKPKSEKYRDDGTAENVSEELEECQNAQETTLPEENDSTNKHELQAFVTSVKEKDDGRLQSDERERKDATQSAEPVEGNFVSAAKDDKDEGDDNDAAAEQSGETHQQQVDNKSTSYCAKDVDISTPDGSGLSPSHEEVDSSKTDVYSVTDEKIPEQDGREVITAESSHGNDIVSSTGADNSQNTSSENLQDVKKLQRTAAENDDVTESEVAASAGSSDDKMQHDGSSLHEEGSVQMTSATDNRTDHSGTDGITPPQHEDRPTTDVNDAADNETESDRRNEDKPPDNDDYDLNKAMTETLDMATVAEPDSTTDGHTSSKTRATEISENEGRSAQSTVTELKDQNATGAPSLSHSDDRSPTSVERSCYEKLVELATCPCCAKMTVDIKMLPCMDYCCVPCLQQQLSRPQDSCNEINCPSCRQAFPISQEGLEHLPLNVYVRAVVPTRADVDQPAQSPVRRQTPCCSVCDTRATPAMLEYCKECRQCLCGQCVKVHQHLRSTKTHHVVGQRQSMLVDHDSLMCSDHPTKTLQVFCSDCVSLCCVACLHEVHRDHNWGDAEQAARGFRQQLDDDAETVRRAASRCEQEIQRLEDAETMITAHAVAVQSQINSQGDYVIDTVNREVAHLREQISQARDVNTARLDQNKERIRKQKQILQCFEKFCQSVVETGTVHEVIHACRSVHETDQELPLQQVLSSTDLPLLEFTPANVRDFLPQHSQYLIGSLSYEKPNQNITWDQLHSQLQQTLEQRNELQQLMSDSRQNTTCLEERLTEKSELIEKTEKELEEKRSLVDKLEQLVSFMANDIKEKDNAVSDLAEKLQQKERELEECSQRYNNALVEIESKHHSQLSESESKLENATREMHESERSAGEYLDAVNQLNDRVLQLEESLSYSMNNEDEMTTQLKEAWEQITEQSIIIDSVPPTVVKVCSLQGEVAPVYGITAVGEHLFVVRAWSTEIEVYESTMYSLLCHLSVPCLVDVTDMAGCEQHQCLYLADCRSQAVHTVSTKDTQVLGQWSLGDEPYGVSVSGDDHVVISFSKTSTIAIFTHDHVLLHRISVEDVVNLRHAVVLDTGQLVICHGSLQYQSGVSIIDADGQVVKTLPAGPESHLGWPTHVAADHRGFIYVADYNGKRILQLDSHLSHITDIVGYDDGLRNPRSIFVNSVRRRMYVAESGGSVLVFGFS